MSTCEIANLCCNLCKEQNNFENAVLVLSHCFYGEPAETEDIDEKEINERNDIANKVVEGLIKINQINQLEQVCEVFKTTRKNSTAMSSQVQAKLANDLCRGFCKKDYVQGPYEVFNSIRNIELICNISEQVHTTKVYINCLAMKNKRLDAFQIFKNSLVNNVYDNIIEPLTIHTEQMRAISKILRYFNSHLQVIAQMEATFSVSLTSPQPWFSCNSMKPVNGISPDFSTSEASTEHLPSKKLCSITVTNEKEMTLIYCPTPMHGSSTQEHLEEEEVISDSEGSIRNVVEEERSQPSPQAPQRRLIKDLSSTTNPTQARNSILKTVCAELTSLQRKNQIPPDRDYLTRLSKKLFDEYMNRIQMDSDSIVFSKNVLFEISDFVNERVQLQRQKDKE